MDSLTQNMFAKITYSIGYTSTGFIMNGRSPKPAWGIDIKIEFHSFDKGRLDISLNSIFDE